MEEQQPYSAFDGGGASGNFLQLDGEHPSRARRGTFGRWEVFKSRTSTIPRGFFSMRGSPPCAVVETESASSQPIAGCEFKKLARKLSISVIPLALSLTLSQDALACLLHSSEL